MTCARLRSTATSYRAPKELFALAVHVPGEVQRLLTSVGWTAEDVDHYIFHQPSQAILERVFDAVGARPAGVRPYALGIREYRQYLMGGRAESTV